MSNRREPTSSLETTFFKYRDQLVRVIGKIVRPDDIEDIVQETFVKSYEAQLKQEISYEKTYMLRTARNLALNHVGSASHRQNLSLQGLPEEPHSLESMQLEREIESKQRFIQFCRATETLSEEVKRVFLLKKVYGMSQKDIAEYVGISQSTVEKHVAKGLLQCAVYLEKQTDSQRGSSPHSVSSSHVVKVK